jgi:hypothetical protein
VRIGDGVDYGRIVAVAHGFVDDRSGKFESLGVNGHNSKWQA